MNLCSEQFCAMEVASACSFGYCATHYLLLSIQSEIQIPCMRHPECPDKHPNSQNIYNNQVLCPTCYTMAMSAEEEQATVGPVQSSALEEEEMWGEMSSEPEEETETDEQDNSQVGPLQSSAQPEGKKSIIPPLVNVKILKTKQKKKRKVIVISSSDSESNEEPAQPVRRKRKYSKRTSCRRCGSTKHTRCTKNQCPKHPLFIHTPNRVVEQYECGICCDEELKRADVLLCNKGCSFCKDCFKDLWIEAHH